MVCFFGFFLCVSIINCLTKMWTLGKECQRQQFHKNLISNVGQHNLCHDCFVNLQIVTIKMIQISFRYAYSYFRKKNNVSQFINVSVFCCSPCACTESTYSVYDACVMNLRQSYCIQKMYSGTCNKKPHFSLKTKVKTKIIFDRFLGIERRKFGVCNNNLQDQTMYMS